MPCLRFLCPEKGKVRQAAEIRWRVRWFEACTCWSPGGSSAAALRHLEIVGLKDRAELPPIKLSGGEQQRVAIAREIGLAGADNTIVITGEQMRGLSETQLRLTLDTPEVIFARVSADQKGASSQR